MPQSDSELRDILAKTRTLAVVGIKDDITQDAHRVPAYMQDAGYRIVPINPKLESVLGEKAVATLADVSGPVDMVNFFRASDHIPAHVEEILARTPRPLAVWMQLGIHNGTAAAKLRAAGIQVIQDRCIMIEHRRLLGGVKA